MELYTTRPVTKDLGDGLMPAAPLPPGQDVLRSLLEGQDEAPPQAADFRHAPRERSSRPALMAAIPGAGLHHDSGPAPLGRLRNSSQSSSACRPRAPRP